MSTSAYAAVAAATLDPIMALDQEFRHDTDAKKVNLVVGVYQNEHGESPVLDAVKAAEKYLFENESTKSYLPIEGERGFLDQAERLVFANLLGTNTKDRISSMHTPGGTGALRLAGDFFVGHHSDKTVWISSPAYPNHPGIMSTLGLSCDTYRYFTLDAARVLFDEMLEDLSAAKPGDIVVLHGCCHNPSGADMSDSQWKTLANFLEKRRLFPIVDLAYLGYADGLQYDNAAIGILFESCPEGIVTTSFSKNFALYAERTGMISFIANKKGDAEKCVGTAKTYARKIYTSPPAHGSRIIETVLSSEKLSEQWKNEVADMRQRLKDMRQLFSDSLTSAGVDLYLFPGLTDLKGMFALTRLQPSQVDALRREHHIYMLPNGRVSIAGLRPSTMDHLVASIAAIV